MPNGANTVEFAQRLFRKLNPDYTLFYDHGDREDENVCACKAVIGDTLSNKTRIADIDIAILKEAEVVYLIEIEESGTLSPKKLFGDFLTFQMLDSIFIEKVKYNITEKTKYIIGGLINPKGNSQKKINNIKEKLKGKIQNPRVVNIFTDEKIDEVFNFIVDLINKEKILKKY